MVDQTDTEKTALPVTADFVIALTDRHAVIGQMLPDDLAAEAAVNQLKEADETAAQTRLLAATDPILDQKPFANVTNNLTD